MSKTLYELYNEHGITTTKTVDEYLDSCKIMIKPIQKTAFTSIDRMPIREVSVFNQNQNRI